MEQFDKDLHTEGAFVRGQAHGFPLNWLIDTGSSVTIIHPSIYTQICSQHEIVLQKPPTNMVSASGEIIPCLGHTVCPIAIDGKCLNHSVWVAEIENSGILGYDFLSKYKCSVDFESGEITMHELPGSPYDDYEESQSVACCRITFNQEFSIPPESEAIIPAKLVECSLNFEQGIYNVEPTYEFANKYELLVAKAVVDTSSNDMMIRVFNQNSSPQKVFKNQVVATCEPVV